MTYIKKGIESIKRNFYLFAAAKFFRNFTQVEFGGKKENWKTVLEWSIPNIAGNTIKFILNSQFYVINKLTSSSHLARTSDGI